MMQCKCIILISALPTESQLLHDHELCFTDVQEGLTPPAQVEGLSLQPLMPQGVRDRQADLNWGRTSDQNISV